METLFETRYVRNKEIAKEFFGFYYFKRKGILFWYVFMLLLFVLDVIAVICDDVYSLYILIIVPFFFLIQIWSYFRQVRLMTTRDCESHGGEITVETIVTDEGIQCTSSNGGVYKVEYDKVKKAIKTKNLIILQTKAKVAYLLPKDAFTKGSAEEFIAFLKAKGIKIK